MFDNTAYSLGDLMSVYQANQFCGFAGKHWPQNDFNPSYRIIIIVVSLAQHWINVFIDY